jgi:hypothetical protein
MQYEFTAPASVLDERGRVKQPGFAKHPLLEYRRNHIKASKWRIKEWDYYAVLNSEYGISMTIADLSYSAMVTVVFFDFIKRTVERKTKLLWFTFGKMKLPESSLEGDVTYHDSEYELAFIRRTDERILNVSVARFRGEETLRATLTAIDMHDESMTILTPWDDCPKAFYYNQKINCMPTFGNVTIGASEYRFDKTTSFAVLDWGRGVWTYKNTWYWGSASGVVDGKRFGFNIGYGFGNTSWASENMVLYDGKAHKLDQVRFELDPMDFLKPWRFTANDGRFEMTMTPILDRQDDLNFGIIKNLGHQVFGLFQGTATLDDGTILEIHDLLGFAEKITNHY